MIRTAVTTEADDECEVSTNRWATKSVRLVSNYRNCPAEVAKVVSTMKTGEISNPFLMVNSKGKEVCAVVKLKTHIKAHRASMSEDFQVLKDVVMAKLQEQKINQWIKDKQKSTYIRINEGWGIVILNIPDG